MAKINKYHLMLLPNKEMVVVEAGCVITTQGAYMFYNEFDINSTDNLLVSAYPIRTTIIKNVER